MKGTEWMRMVTEWADSVEVKVSKKKTVDMMLKGKFAKSRCESKWKNIDVC